MPNIVYTRIVQKTEVNYIFTCSLACLFCLAFNVWCWVRIVRGWAAFGPYCFTAAVCVAKASALSLNVGASPLCLRGWGCQVVSSVILVFPSPAAAPAFLCSRGASSRLLPLQQGWRVTVWSSAQGLWWHEGSCADLLLNLSEGRTTAF